MAAPGWYPDPEKPGAQRYWDGQAWGQSAPAASPTYTQPAPGAGPGAMPGVPAAAKPARPASPLANRAPILAWALISILLLIVGSVGTWISAGGGVASIDVNGTDRDGPILIVLGVLALPLLGVYFALSGVVVARVICASIALFFALLALLISIADLIDVTGEENTFLDISPGWGLILCVVAALSLVISLIVAVAVRRFR